MDFKYTKNEEKAINLAFTPYVFYKKGADSVECWCTSCKKHFFVPLITKSVRKYTFLQRLTHNGEVRCPHCERLCTAKSAGRAKDCKNLFEEQKVVVIHKLSENKITARSAYFYKKYHRDYYFPTIECRAYRHYDISTKGVKCFELSDWSGKWFERQKFCSPFRNTNGSMFYWNVSVDSDYTVVGLDRLKNTFLKYHQLDLFVDRKISERSFFKTYDIDIIPYLCYFVFYPQMEMLQKLGFERIVNSLVMFDKKTWPYVDWKAKSINEFFKMTKQEYKDFCAVLGDRKQDAVELLEFRSKIKKLGGNYSFSSAKKYKDDCLFLACFTDAVKTFENLNEPIMPGINYLIKQKRKCKTSNFSYFHGLFKDYRTIVKKYKLGNSQEVLYPPHLIAAHDRAAAIERAALEEKKAKENAQKERKYRLVHEKNLTQYQLSGDGFEIIVPSTVKQILDEGKNMQHCVGGYADRHLNGTLTILFLRTSDAPDKSLYTIEMHNKKLYQVQGYHNRTPLTKEAQAFFDKWLAWVQAGSKRRKDGSPIIKELKPIAG